MNNTFMRLAYRGLVRNFKRTMITAVAVIIGFVGLVLFGGYVSRVDSALKTQTLYLNMNGHLIVRKKGSENYWVSPKKYIIDKKSLDILKEQIGQNLENFEFFNEKLKVAGQIINGDKNFPVFIEGNDVAAEEKSRWHQEFKDHFLGFFDYLPQHLKKGPDSKYGISITPSLSRQLGVIVRDEKDSVNFEAQLVGLDFESNLNAIEVVASRIHQSSSEFMRAFSVESDINQARLLANVDGASELNIFLKKDQNLAKAQRTVQEIVDKAFPDLYEVKRFDTEDISPEYIGHVGLMKVMLGFFIALIGGTVTLSVLNVLTMSIYERSAEIGTLLSIGFKRSQVQSLFVAEAFILGAIGILCGAFVGKIIAYFVNQLKLPFHPPGALGTAYVIIDLTWPMGLMIAGFLISLLVISSYVLARKLTKKNLVQLLYEVEGGN